MTKTLFRQVGIALHTIKYSDYDVIATIFTREAGIIKVIIKGGMRIKRRSPLTALTLGEFLYAESRGEIHLCKEMTILKRYYGHPHTLDQLQASCTLATTLRHSQLPEKPALKLYDLFHTYLSLISSSPHPQKWVCSFWLKLLKFEGVIFNLSHCETCQGLLESGYFSQGEIFCTDHAPPSSLFFDAMEQKMVNVLTHSQNITALDQQSPSEEFVSKIRKILQQTLHIEV